jgi:hypothetical protein
MTATGMLKSTTKRVEEAVVQRHHDEVHEDERNEQRPAQCAEAVVLPFDVAAPCHVHTGGSGLLFT